MTLTLEQIILDDVADQLLFNASALELAKALLTPEQVAEMGLENIIARDLELAEKAMLAAKVE
jgi:hypothetical protein